MFLKRTKLLNEDTFDIVFEKRYGSDDEDKAISIYETDDSGYIIAGYTQTGKEKGKKDTDFWVLKLDSNGIIIWDKTFGGNKNDKAYDVI